MRQRITRDDHASKDGGTREDQAARQAVDDLFSLTYEELRRLASSVKRSSANVTLDSTALVNEAWLKLAQSPSFASTSPLHFKRIAARAMRQVLVEAARRRMADKRGGGSLAMVPLDSFTERDGSSVQDLLGLDDALHELEQLEPRQAQVVESRFFGGLDVAETAALLEVSEATIHREWRVAKAWLKHRLRRV